MKTKKKPFSHTLKVISESVKKIMPEICGILDKNNINYVTNPKKTEIIVPDSKVDVIKKMVTCEISVSTDTLKYAIEFVKLKDTVYIRQRVQ
jgi:hypothetical protein